MYQSVSQLRHVVMESCIDIPNINLIHNKIQGKAKSSKYHDIAINNQHKAFSGTYFEMI